MYRNIWWFEFLDFCATQNSEYLGFCYELSLVVIKIKHAITQFDICYFLFSFLGNSVGEIKYIRYKFLVFGTNQDLGCTERKYMLYKFLFYNFLNVTCDFFFSNEHTIEMKYAKCMYG